MTPSSRTSRRAEIFPIRDLPTHEALQRLAERFPDLDPTAAETTLLLLRVSTDVLTALDVWLAANGLSKGRLAVLMQLLRTGGDGATPSQLAERAGVTRATITGLVDGLVRDGLVLREGRSSDRRSVMVRLTRDGEDLLNRFLPGHFRKISALMAHLSETERSDLVRLVGKVREGLSELEAES